MTGKKTLFFYFEKCKNKSNTKEPPKKSPKVPKLP